MDGEDYRDYQRDAAQIGTIVHDLIEDDIYEREWQHDLDDLLPEDRDRVNTAMAAFRSWKRDHGFEIVDTEIQLVCEDLKFGGTPDFIARVHGDEICMFDWKTSGKIYDDYKLQVAAYIYLYETNKDVSLDGGAHILRISKEDGSFLHGWWPRNSMKSSWLAFKQMRELYETMKKVKGEFNA